MWDSLLVLSVKDDLRFVFGGLVLCKRDALPTELTAPNQKHRLFITLIIRKQHWIRGAIEYICEQTPYLLHTWFFAVGFYSPYLVHTWRLFNYPRSSEGKDK